MTFSKTGGNFYKIMNSIVFGSRRLLDLSGVQCVVCGQVAVNDEISYNQHRNTGVCQACIDLANTEDSNGE